jgi:hypothetical protein
LKNVRMSFLGRCNVEKSLVRASLLGLSCSKVAGFEGGLFINFSRATFFIFISTQMVDMYLSYFHWNKFDEKNAVWIWATLKICILEESSHKWPQRETFSFHFSVWQFLFIGAANSPRLFSVLSENTLFSIFHYNIMKNGFHI